MSLADLKAVMPGGFDHITISPGTAQRLAAAVTRALPARPLAGVRIRIERDASDNVLMFCDSEERLLAAVDWPEEAKR